jgi:hypothetical protein
MKEKVGLSHTIAKGTFTSLASVFASRVLPLPVGPSIIIFDLSSSTVDSNGAGGGAFCSGELPGMDVLALLACIFCKDSSV